MRPRTRRKVAEEHLILLSAGTLELRERTVPEMRRLRDEVDWADVAELLRARRLLTLLGPRLLKASEGRAEAQLGPLLEEALGTGGRHGTFLEMVGGRARDVLRDAGIRCSLLKGPALSRELYGDPGRRVSADLDLLVAPTDLPAAVAQMRSLGYTEPSDHAGRDGLPLLHFAMVHEQDLLPPVELHWRVHWYERRFAAERLLAPDGAAPDWRPLPADQLAALLLFYARDGFVDLRLATDVAAFWDARGEELGAGALTRVMEDYPGLTRALQASAMVAGRLVGLPARTLLVGSPEPTARGWVAARLARPYPHASEPQLYADMGLIDGLLSPSGELGGFVRRQLVIPHEVRRGHAHKARRDRVSSTPGHAMRVLGRYAVALAGLVWPARPWRPGELF